ncbi:hypothetical protein CKM354_000175000 [Cercospora kikuchii]|uniref:DUF7708 domain-containing protein n=1 Tax=Cercospora kikuchii TaxID=84275 RepID=A0A9P3CDC1_9PEZI|nr:uncharacterized protein CKM354_000175000 [Cercospora kikuchii]GIZ38330.1 hypothetical protein CKM354_000175000 [Cercospora kikuchii]
MGTPLSAAETTFQTALKLFRAQHSSDSHAEWLHDKHTQSDVQASIQQAKEKYDGRAQGKIRKLLANISTGILGYGKVMDVLAQHHPEYVSLAWGTTKLLFILFQNHDELITELAKSMNEIADTLPRVEQYMDLYNDPILQSKIEELFVLIMGHFEAMLKFYQERRLKHAWKALIQPYSIRFKSLKQEIDTCSRAIEQYVSVKLHVVLADLRQVQSAIDLKVRSLDTNARDQSTRVDLIYKLLCDIQANTALLPSMSLTLQETQLADMITHTTDTRLLRPTDCLQAWVALCNRQKLHQNLALQNVWSSSEVRQWSMAPEPAIIIMQGSTPTRKQTYAIGTYMTRFVQQSKTAVLWALPAVSSADFSMTWIDLLRYLIMQAL